MTEVRWYLDHIEHVRSDLSRFHRIDDMESMRADRFWCYVENLAYYHGCVAALMLHERAVTSLPEPSVSIPEATRAAPQAMPIVTADNVDEILANQLYGDVPGLAAIFSHSTVKAVADG